MKRSIVLAGMFAVAVVLIALCALAYAVFGVRGQSAPFQLLMLSAVAVFVLSPIYFTFASRMVEKRVIDAIRPALGALRELAGKDYLSSAQFSLREDLSAELLDLDNLSYCISKRISEISAERDHIAYNLDNMSEGLVVLDGSLNISLINKSARAFFSAHESILGQNLLLLTHIPSTLDAALKASESNKHTVFDIDIGDKTLQIFVSPVQYDDANVRSGAIMLITDVTAVRRAEQIRSDFVANASHELKTPLTSIKGFTELMQSGIVEDVGQVAKYLGLIHGETDRMIVLINDILELSELETALSDTGRAQVSLKIIAQRVAESLAPQAKVRDVSVEVAGDAGVLSANPDRMTELVLNLVDNAVKYNNPGGSVRVTVAQHEDHVSLDVADTGVGIPPEAQSRVFERFYRVDKSRSRKQGGTGLGLAIVKHIVGLYKGEISLESTPGRGTDIRVTLPLE